MQAVGRWFWRILIGNPQVVRIVQSGSRRSQHNWFRMGYLGVLILLVLFGLLTGGGLKPDLALNDLAQAGAQVFRIVAYGQVILVCLLAPLFMAATISSEQQGETYDILMTTPLSSLQIVLGSLMGRLFFVLALLLSGLPLFSILLLFGGVPITSVWSAMTVAAMTALFMGAVAVTLSVLRAGGRKAVFGFVIAVAGYLMAAYLLDVIVLRRLTPTVGTSTWLTPLHPLLVLEATVDRANYRPPTPGELVGMPGMAKWYLANPLAAYSLLTGLLSVVMIGFSAVALRKIGQGDWWPVLLLRKLTGSAELRQRAGRTVWEKPIAWREANTRGRGLSAILGRWGYAAVCWVGAAVLLGMYHFQNLPSLPNQNATPAMRATGQFTPNAIMDPAQVFQAGLSVLLMLEIAVVTLVAVYMSAGCVSKEREDGTLDLILTTPVTPKQYVWGKLRGLVRFLSLLIAVPVGTLALVAVYSGLGMLLGWTGATYAHTTFLQGSSNRITVDAMLMRPEAPVLLAVMLTAFVSLCVAVGMNFSLKAKGVLGAVAQTLGIVGVLGVLLGFCGWAIAGSLPVVGPAINAFSPMTNVFMLVNPHDNVAGFTREPIAGRLVLTVSAALVAGGYGVIVYAVVLSMVKNFDHTVRRLSGTG